MRVVQQCPRCPAEYVEWAQGVLGEAYSFIERKLKNKEFAGGFSEYEQDVRSFQQYFLDNGP